MAYTIYDIKSTRSEKTYSTETAAKRQCTRLNNQSGFEKFDYAEVNVYRNRIEKMVERINMMTGKKYMESVNTPSYCSPASEAYWNM